MNRATTAVETHKNASVEEEIAMAWASCEVDYNVGKAGNYEATRADYYTVENLNKYLAGKGTVSSVIYNERGTSRVDYTSNSEKNITNKLFRVSTSGEVETSPVPPSTSKLMAIEYE